MLLFGLPALLLTCIIMYSIAGIPSQQFSDLASAFLQGHLYFLHPIGGIGQDPLLYSGHEYWGEGLFPALVLVPFVALFKFAFHLFFYQGYLDWLFVLGTIYLVYKLARQFKYTVEDSIVWAAAFALGSAFAGVAVVSSSWLFAQVVCTFLLFWALYEYFSGRRWWLIGALCSCIFLTRATATPIVIFFVLELWQGFKKFRPLPFLPLAVPVAVAMGVQGLYNFLRFHSPLNGGYEYQLLGASSAESRSLGVFSWRHIPANLYSLLLRGPVTALRTNTSWTQKFPYIRNNTNGMSLFITSPYFLYLLGRKWTAFSRTARHLLIAAAVSCVTVLCFYGIGRNQFGYRYSLDFLPELFVVLMLAYRAEHNRLTSGMRFLLLAAGILNAYLLATFVLP